MTLNELIKVAFEPAPMITQAPYQQQPKQPVQPQLPHNEPGIWRGNVKAPNQQKRDKHGWTVSTFTIPGASASAADKQAWERQRRIDLLDRDPNFQFTDRNKYLWNADAANKYIQEHQNAAPSNYSSAAWWNPVNWIKGAFGRGGDAYMDRELAMPTNVHDPVLFAAQRGFTSGQQQQAAKDAASVSGDLAVAASWSPYFVPEFSDWIHGRSWQNSRDLSMLKQEYADELLNAGYTPDEVAKKVGDLGYWVDADASIGGVNVGGTARFLQDFAREVGARGLVINMVAPGVVSGGAKLLKPVGTAATHALAPVGQALSHVPGATALGKSIAWTGHAAFSPAYAMTSIGGKVAPHLPAFISNKATNWVANRMVGMTRYATPTFYTTLGIAGLTRAGEQTDGALHDAFMTMGLNTQRMGERKLKEHYGTYGAMMSDYGNSVRGAVQEDGSFSQNIEDYDLYKQWATNHGFEDLNSPEAQKAYVDWYTNNGAVDSTIVWTPMFQNMSAEDQASSMRNYIKQRILFTNKVPSTISQAVGGDSHLDMFAFGLEHDTDGSLHTAFGNMLMAMSPEAFAEFLSSGANAEGGASEKADIVYKELENGILARSANDPNGMADTVDQLMKLNMARQAANNNPNAGPSKGASAVRHAILTAAADSDIIDNMSDDKAVELAQHFATMQGNGGPSTLTPEEEALAGQVKENLQGKMWDAFLSNPGKNGPLLASMFFSSKGLTGLADIAKNPWMFWVGAGALLLGGLLLIDSGLDVDDDEGEEDEDPYETALAKNPYA